MDEDNGKLEQFLELLRIEIEARDNSETVGNPPRKQKKRRTIDSANVNECITRKI